ncbi:MAG: hypothetical protein OEX12_10860 [Gammaproteobacteria bacterium]|nr:hypothetical protein [Gammaproteobacteria bacterium]
MQQKRQLVVIFLLWTIISSGCAAPGGVAKLPLPDRPHLPAISANEYVPIKDMPDHYMVTKDTVTKIITRDKLRHSYELKLEAVIKATH